jgi:hypothetical protein
MTAFAWVAGVTLCALTTAGCAPGPKPAAKMRLASHEMSAVFLQRFAQASATDRSDAATDIVLSGAPDDGLNQLMHLRLLWRPMRGTKTDQPSTTNAVIDWYVWDAGSTTGGPPSVMKYTGAGLVMADRMKGGRLRVTVKNATVRLKSRRGSLVDPVGPATLTGSFVVPYDTAKVDNALASIPVGIPRTAAGATNTPR